MALPEEKPYLEYVCGRVVQKMPPRRKHGELAVEIGAFLAAYRRTHGGTVAAEYRVGLRGVAGREARLPDVAYWAPGRAVGADELGLPPTLAIELRSPSESMASQRRKCRAYRENGTEVCWLIDPERRVVERFEGDADAERVPADGTLTTAALPGFALPLGELFAVLDG